MTAKILTNPAYLIPSKYLVAEDFGHDGVPDEPRATIDRVEKVETGPGSRGWPLIYFKETWAKPLRINATHRKALCLMFGAEDWTSWYGKRIDFRVVRGNFPNGKTTAVRIKGSPDITRAFTFEVQKFGSRDKDRYTLEPTGKNLVLGPGFVRFGRKAGHYAKPFAEITVEQFAELLELGEAHLASPDGQKMTEKGRADLVANMKEMREELRAREPQLEPEPEQAQPEEKGEEPVL